MNDKPFVNAFKSGDELYFFWMGALKNKLFLYICIRF